MSININTSSLEKCSNNIAQSEGNINSALTKLKKINNKENHNEIKNIYDSLDNLNANSRQLSNKITDVNEEIKAIEKKSKNFNNSNNKQQSYSALTKELTDNLDNNKEFEKTGATITKNKNTDIKSSNYTTSVWEKISDGFKSVGECLSNTKATIAKGAKSIFNKIKSFGKSAIDTVSNIWSNILDVLAKTGASIANSVIALVQGIAEFAEAIVDTCAIVATAVSSLVTGLYDGYQWINGKITNNDNWHSLTKSMWNNSMDFVSTSYVSDAFDNFHTNTKIGKMLDEKAFSPFKSSGIGYKIIDGVGYATGIVLLTIATAGVGGAVTGGVAGASEAIGSLGATSFAATAGVAGFGHGTEEAWADGNSLGDGLVYGLERSILDAATTYISERFADGFAENIATRLVKPKKMFEKIDPKKVKIASVIINKITNKAIDASNNVAGEALKITYDRDEKDEKKADNTATDDTKKETANDNTLTYITNAPNINATPIIH